MEKLEFFEDIGYVWRNVPSPEEEKLESQQIDVLIKNIFHFLLFFGVFYFLTQASPAFAVEFDKQLKKSVPIDTTLIENVKKKAVGQVFDYRPTKKKVSFVNSSRPRSLKEVFNFSDDFVSFLVEKIKQLNLKPSTDPTNVIISGNSNIPTISTSVLIQSMHENMIRVKQRNLLLLAQQQQQQLVKQSFLQSLTLRGGFFSEISSFFGLYQFLKYLANNPVFKRFLEHEKNRNFKDISWFFEPEPSSPLLRIWKRIKNYSQLLPGFIFSVAYIFGKKEKITDQVGNVIHEIFPLKKRTWVEYFVWLFKDISDKPGKYAPYAMVGLALFLFRFLLMWHLGSPDGREEVKEGIKTLNSRMTEFFKRLNQDYSSVTNDYRSRQKSNERTLNDLLGAVNALRDDTKTEKVELVKTVNRKLNGLNQILSSEEKHLKIYTELFKNLKITLAGLVEKYPVIKEIINSPDGSSLRRVQEWSPPEDTQLGGDILPLIFSEFDEKKK